MEDRWPVRCCDRVMKYDSLEPAGAMGSRTAPGEGGDMTAAMAPTQPLNATDLCDRCGAQAYVRVVLPGSGQLLFCAHHNRQHAEALAKIAVDIQDETDRLSRPQNSTER
jgi:hypothetical protein